ncbi:ShlB/FhaC/HecB family hemolysin secretion/activation protein [Photorhabdus antumapuensis]|uniref:ShlB/FhaC/HecB family hemolysin secretion/activation protein n=1 Tax=Photorhabdus antumapuensis TaxID=2862867 RepID=UPI001CEC5852|nr:ShlB/FhaC/HecB family hemolysin secretion/activation protein [Photorhabdus antumapuensis]MCA6221737.1 ShlB/FhaC/HecB family hemolysin secretion/activation protein [Photorhabdus antumapuensis]
MSLYSLGRISVHSAGLLILALLAISGKSTASSLISPVDQNAITQQQKDLLQQAQQQRDDIRNSITLSPLTTPISDDEGSFCHPIYKIQFEGTENLSVSVQQVLSKPYLSRCLTAGKINELVRKVSNTYIEKGYVTSLAGLKEQDLSTGILTITVTEGKVGTIQLDGETLLALKMVFPDMPGKPLNLRDIEQGMEQLNRLPSQQITIDIQPAKQPGYSDVILKRTTSQLPVHASLGIDNSGQKNTGQEQINTTLGLDNPLRLADLWSISANRNSDFHHNHLSWSVTSGVTIPYGYWSFDYQYVRNSSFQMISADTFNARHESKGQTNQLKINRTLYRDGQQKLALNMGLVRRQTSNVTAGVKLSVSSPTLNTASLGANYSTVLAGGYLTFNPTFNHGLTGWGATKDNSGDRNAPKSQFRKFSLSSSYFIPVTEDIYCLSSLYGQFTPDNLYAGERLSLGGQYSVRGFKEQNLIGNNGGYWRNELNWKLTRLPLLGELSLNSALDTGWLENNKKRQIEGGNVTGTSLGISFNHSRMNQTITIGKPLIYPNHLRPDHWVVYWSASLNF